MNGAERVALIILDGWGLGPDPEVDAIARGCTPVFDELMRSRPHATLTTHGTAVGLPEGQMGNSEVGHLNIGAGRIVYQELVRINRAIQDGSLAKNTVLNQALDKAKTPGQKLHLLALASEGGVHSHLDHLIALIDLAETAGVPDIRIHAFTDGRDTGPETGIDFIRRLEEHLEKAPHTRLASIIGRYYAMDRDQRWERVKKAYDLLVHELGEKAESGVEALRLSYAAGITDEFVEPIVIARPDDSPGRIESGDVVIFVNFRTDRPRQLTTVLTLQAFPEWGMTPLDLHFVTMTRYDEAFTGIPVIFEKDNLHETLGEVLSREGRSQLRMAETEKYPHVTYFFSGGREAPFPGEDRLVVPSPKVATYDLQPEMSAPELTDAVLKKIAETRPDFICLNFANTDMVGHTGVFSAAMRAAETVDGCLGRLLPAALAAGYHLILIADHGNSDTMINPDGTPHTAHTMNPVPVIYLSPQPDGEVVLDGKLADISPTILHLFGIEVPARMDGLNLVKRKNG